MPAPKSTPKAAAKRSHAKKEPVAPDPVDEIREELGRVYTKEAVEKIIDRPVQALGNVTPRNAAAAGNLDHILRWARNVAGALFNEPEGPAE